MFIRRQRRRPLVNGEPLFHSDHSRPRTRREFISQGFTAGMGAVVGSSLFSMFAAPRKAYADLSPDLEALKSRSGIAKQGSGKLTFTGFDLAAVPYTHPTLPSRKLS